MDNYLFVHNNGCTYTGNLHDILERTSLVNHTEVKLWGKKAEVGDYISVRNGIVIKLKPKKLTFGKIEENQLFLYDECVHQKIGVFKLDKQLCKARHKRVNALDINRQFYYFEDDDVVEPYET